jgi:hypothetical protein
VDFYSNRAGINEADFLIGPYLAKKSYYARSFDEYVGKWGENDPDIRKQLGLFYRFVGVFIEKGKWIRLLAHPVLSAGMFFLRILVGIRYLRRGG